MTNAELFRFVFGIYLTEIWAKPEDEFLEWAYAETTLYKVLTSLVEAFK